MRGFLAVFSLFFTLTSFLLEHAGAKPPEQTDVLIIGAGLAGLGTAYELKKSASDLGYHILEITPRVGGRVKTVKYSLPDGQVYSDSGMEEYWESNPAVKILEELKLPVRSDVALSSMVLGGRLYELGDESKEEFLKRMLTVKGYAELEKFKKEVTPIIHELYPHDAVVRSATQRALTKKTMALKDISFQKYLEQKGLSKPVQNWIRVSIECEAGTQWDRISALDGLAELHIFLGEGEKSYRVLGGNEVFTNALAKAVGERNITVNQRVTRVKYDSATGHVLVSYLDQETNESRTITAKHVVSTIPLYRLFEVQFEPALSSKKQQAIQSQAWGAYFKAHVFLPPAAEKYWMRGESSILPILSDSELGVIYDGNPDQKEKTRILSLLVSGSMADAFNMMRLDDVRAQITAKLEKTWPGIGKEIRGMEFYRLHPRAIAAWPVGRSRFDDQSEEIRRPENRVYLAGDFTESSHSSGAFLSAQRAVYQIMQAEAFSKRRGLAEKKK